MGYAECSHVTWYTALESLNLDAFSAIIANTQFFLNNKESLKGP